MRKLSALFFSALVVFGITQFMGSETATPSKSMTYSGVNSEVLNMLKQQVAGNEKLTQLVNSLKEKKNVVYQTHTTQPTQAPYMIGLYLAGLFIGIAGFASLQASKNAEVNASNDLNSSFDVISPDLFSNIMNGNDVERVLEASFNETGDFKGLNQIVAENSVKMNSLFKLSSKMVEVEFDENLSESFIDSNHLNDAVREFMMAGYNLVKHEAQAEGLYLRTSENGQRFNLNCFIPTITKETFSNSDSSKMFIQKLSNLESKLNLYQPRVSLRWVNTSEIAGVDICLSLENKSALESTLQETNA